MIQNQTVNPFVTVKKGMKANQPRFAGNQPSFRNSSTLERTPSSDGYIAPAPAQSSIAPLLIGMGIVGAATVATAFFTHKNTEAANKTADAIEAGFKNISEKLSGKAAGTTPPPAPAPAPVPAPTTASAAAAVEGKGLNIWGDVVLHLKDKGTLKPETVEKIQDQIGRALNGEVQMSKVDKDANIWSVSYEGFGGFSGGQHDIANELPEALMDQGCKNTFAVSPLFKMHETKAGVKTPQYSLTQKEGSANKYTYKTGSKLPGGATEIELTRIDNGKMQIHGNDVELYYGEVGEKKIKTLFVHDPKMFDLGEKTSAGIYGDVSYSPERVRMAQFANLAYETIMKAKEGEIKIPSKIMKEGKEVEEFVQLAAPDKVIAHEAWQSGALLQKMKLYSAVEEEKDLRNLGPKSKDMADYARHIGDNTAVVIHNIGHSYQGWAKNKDEMNRFYNTLYGDHAHAIVENSLIVDKPNRKLGQYGKVQQRVGFVENWMNPAQSAVVLATKIGAVSEGYKKEIVKDAMGGKLTSIIKLKNMKKGITAFPNGISKKTWAASAEHVKKVNDVYASHLKGDKVIPYLTQHSDIINPDNALDVAKYAEDRAHNKKIFLTLLKDTMSEYKKAPADAKGAKKIPDAPRLFFKQDQGEPVTVLCEDLTDLSDIDPSKDIPVYSMVSRLDAQKGFDTMADALVKVMKNWDTNPATAGREKPVFLLSGGNDTAINAHLEKAKKEMGEAGKRVVIVKNRVDDQGLLLANMTSNGCMPSRFEPYGISDAKGLAAGSSQVVTPVGGMQPSGNVSRKIYDFSDDPKTANAITVKDYEIVPPEDMDGAELVKEHNASRLAEAIVEHISLDPAQATRMNINALNTDVSWEKGASQNYLKELNIHEVEAPVQAPVQA